MNKSEHAVEQFQSGMNCSQAVLAEYAEEHGLPPDMALRIASGFGGGMGRTGGACGAVTGAVMAIGLVEQASDPRDPVARGRIQETVQSFLKEFVARNGSTQCRDLLGCDISTPRGYQLAAAEGLFRTKCAKYVEDAVDILEDLF